MSRIVFPAKDQIFQLSSDGSLNYGVVSGLISVRAPKSLMPAVDFLRVTQ